MHLKWICETLTLRDEETLLQEIEFPTSGLASVPGDGEGATEMTESINMIREFCDRLLAPEKARSTRIVCISTYCCYPNNERFNILSKSFLKEFL